MALPNRVLRASVLILLVVSAGCSRAVSIGTDPAPTYAIQVRNTLSQDMIVSYDAGSGPAILGTVRANGSERFVIATRNPTVITVTATDQNRTRTAGPYSVQLQAGVTPEVAIR